MNKDKMGLILDRLIGREITLSSKIKHSSNFALEYAGKSGTLRSYDIGEVEYEEPMALISFIFTVGKKEVRKFDEVWIDARDIVEVQKKSKSVGVSNDQED